MKVTRWRGADRDAVLQWVRALSVNDTEGEWEVLMLRLWHHFNWSVSRYELCVFVFRQIVVVFFSLCLEHV